MVLLTHRSAWLLSPMAIYTDGTLYEYGVNKNSDEVGVRPAMWVRKKIL